MVKTMLASRCANGQQLKCLTVTDAFTKEGLAIDVDVASTLRALVSEHAAAVNPQAWRSMCG